uniref:Crinkler effector protein N-terminal domain-containing protein n=1 Tax=Globisporangium ultimum (strain ATCC 200006 / CBS 805.95 / DAOM BR144) TaxID=431595 RepID=K3WEE5_GLOUD
MVLCCALVGVKAAAFSVQVRKRDLADRLKDEIKKTFASKILCDASSELQLYPGRTNNARLSSDDEAALQLESGHVDASIEAMISAGPMDA